MAPRSAEKFSEMREATKQKIMDVALELFANEGYFQTPISTIAKKAGISKGLMYNYFESKEELLKAIVFHGMETLIQFFDQNHDGVLTNDELLQFINQSFTNIKQNKVYWKLYFSLLVQAPVMQLFKNELRLLIGPFFKMLHDYFDREGYEDPKAEVSFFHSLLDGVGLSYVSDPDNYPIDGVEKKIISIYSKKS
jgi:AcrR family transcriptional regulator